MCFYEELPLYYISSHSHKFITTRVAHKDTCIYGDLTIKTDRQKYDPPPPTSVIKILKPSTAGTDHAYGNTNGGERGSYDSPLPASIIEQTLITNSTYGSYEHTDFNGRNGLSRYEPPLPTSVLQFKSENGKHKTQKLTTMMDWILKYYGKEGDTVLDPTMGSGRMGVSCKSMNREFIGIEIDEEI